MNEYPFTSIVTFALVVLWWVLGSRFSLARATYANNQQNPEMFHFLLHSPEMYSDADFMVAFRNHQNLLEQLVVMLPMLWICATGASDLVASVLGFFISLAGCGTRATTPVISAIDKDFYYLFFHHQRFFSLRSTAWFTL